MERYDAKETDSNSNDVIIVEDLTVGYGDEMVLENVSCSVAKGEIFTLIGESGCGKSTLIRTITGLIEPEHGRIRIAGEEITGADGEEALARARMHMGVLFQSGALFNSLTVAENVALLPLRFTDLPQELVDEMVQMKLELVGLGSHGKSMPAELSGGMKKRAALARAISLDPEILICDEPSSGLDPVTSAEIENLLRELNEYLGVTLVIITHDMETLTRLSTRCVMLDREAKGIVATGPAEELLHESENPVVRKFFQRQEGRSRARGRL
ncbi:MAG: ATP-binding cassette domain-containing protein [Geobacteraceae bacterium]